MKPTLVIRPEAELDVRDACAWYEKQAQGLGAGFLLSLDAALRSIQRRPLQYPIIYRAVRRCLLRRFPYSIFYLVEEVRIVVVAVFHAKRNPISWQERS
jgi:toxin ParE1/3/4